MRLNEKVWWEQDRFWGFVLIVIGVAAITFRPFDKFDDWIRGETDYVLTALLLILAAVIVFVAFEGRPSVKALWLIWMVVP